MKQQKFFNALRFAWQRLLQSAAIFRYSDRAISLVWSTSPSLTLIFAVLTLGAGLFPAVIAYVGKLIVDGVINASRSGLESDRLLALSYVGLEALLIALFNGTQRGLGVCQSLLRVLLGQR